MTLCVKQYFFFYTCRTDLTDARNKVDGVQRQLRDLQGSRKDKLTLFGSWVPELCQRIEQAARRGRFHYPPVGPIGMKLLHCTARAVSATVFLPRRSWTCSVCLSKPLF